jgi:hypothetical protein
MSPGDGVKRASGVPPVADIILRSGSEIRVDDELFCKDGKFVI